MSEDRTPIIIGVGQYLNRVDLSEPAVEPAALMAEALRLSASDAGGRVVLDQLDVIAVVAPISWRYHDPGRVVGNHVGAVSARTWLSAIGGNSPQALINRMATSIADGEIEFGAVVGGESWWTRNRALRAGTQPPWPRQDECEPSWVDPNAGASLYHAFELARGVVAPAECYPLLESALWHESGRTLPQHLTVVAEMWSKFSQVAASNPYAWRRDTFTPDEIVTPSADNRMVATPYTKRMVANPDVEMAAGCLLASVKWARDHGVPSDQWVYVHAGTDANDPYLSERENFTRSAAIEVAGTRAMSLAGIAASDLAHVDLYSCFPSAVQIAQRELSIPSSMNLTVYGGLAFAGGPWNNPVSHAVASMTTVLREDPGSTGLVTANGGNLQKHSFGVYSTAPPTNGYRYEKPQAEVDARGRRATSLEYLGPVTIEALTVIYNRDGEIDRAHAATLTPEGTRVWGVVRDVSIARDVVGKDLVGTPAMIGVDGALNLNQ